MNKILIYIVLVIFTAFLESIAHSAGLVSVALIISVMIAENDRSWLAVGFISILSLILDSFYFNFIGTFFFSTLVTVIIHMVLKKLLPYDNVLMRIPILFISFLSFHFSIYYISNIGGQGSSEVPEIGIFILKTLFEVIIFILLTGIMNRFYNKNVNSGGIIL